MRKETYFKIIELSDYQVLFEKGVNEKDEMHTIEVKAYVDGMRVVQTHEYHEEEKRNEMFDTIGVDIARSVIDSIKGLS